MNVNPLIECVPNFSEGRRPEVIAQIAAAVRSVDGVRLLHVDAGEAANRTVLTFAGRPDSVCEAAFRAVSTAARLIDMRRQQGTHPRIGATDVLPLVPVSGVTLDEVALMAQRLARRVADELRIPCYLYESSALREEHRLLADCRRGEYEALAQRMGDPVDGPDYGRRPWDEALARTGCTVVGGRPFLVAVNFNLQSRDTAAARRIAARIRERGGGLRAVRAIGWFIEEYDRCQVSCNLTDYRQTSLYTLYHRVCQEARREGIGVTGTEIIGLVPRSVLGDDLAAAIRTLHLDDLGPFDVHKKVLEALL